MSLKPRNLDWREPCGSFSREGIFERSPRSDATLKSKADVQSRGQGRRKDEGGSVKFLTFALRANLIHPRGTLKNPEDPENGHGDRARVLKAFPAYCERALRMLLRAAAAAALQSANCSVGRTFGRT